MTHDGEYKGFNCSKMEIPWHMFNGCDSLCIYKCHIERMMRRINSGWTKHDVTDGLGVKTQPITAAQRGGRPQIQI